MSGSPWVGYGARCMGATNKLGLQIFVVVLSIIPLYLGNAIRTGGPLAQIDKFAALRTERPVWIARIVEHCNGTLRTMDFAKNVVG